MVRGHHHHHHGSSSRNERDSGNHDRHHRATTTEAPRHGRRNHGSGNHDRHHRATTEAPRHGRRNHGRGNHHHDDSRSSHHHHHPNRSHHHHRSTHRSAWWREASPPRRHHHHGGWNHYRGWWRRFDHDEGEVHRDRYRTPRDRGAPRRGSSGGGDCSCCCGCLGALLGCLGAILCCGFRSPGGDASRRGARATSSSSSWILPAGLGCSVLLWLGIVANSGLDAGAALGDGGVWMLYAGETQRVVLPWMVRAVEVSVVPDSTSDPSVEAAVFSFARCPPLTGPPVVLQHDSELDLYGGDYEYDYYNLAKGSTVDVKIRQLDGRSSFYLLRGAAALDDIRDGLDTDPDHWAAIAVAQRQGITSRGSVHYRVPATDVFTLVYDNDSSSRASSLDAETDLVLTTHNLAGFSPLCDRMSVEGGDTCFFRATQDDCVVLEAFSASSSGGSSDSNRMVSLRVETYRHWNRIWVVSSIPLCAAFFVRVGQLLFFLCAGGRRAASRPEEEPLLPEGYDDDNEEARPPVTAPGYAPRAVPAHPVPSAPPEEDPPVIVIPPESVEAVPLPAAAK